MTAVVAAAALAATLGTAQAQNNPNHTDGDLVLFFQNPGGAQGANQQLFASLGNTATFFRQAYVDQSNHINLLNIGSQLSSTYGAGWASATTLYGGLGGAWGIDPDITDLVNGDPHRTVYTSRARNSAGTVGSANSSGISISGNGGMTQMAGAVQQQNNIFETLATTQVANIANGVGATIGSINPAGGASWNNRIAAPGVQQQGSAGNLGSFFSINNVQFMWDIYRVQAVDDLSGQFGENDGIRSGLFLGTVVLDNSGDVSFVTNPIPEPGTWVAVAVAAALLGGGTYKRLRRRTATTA